MAFRFSMESILKHRKRQEELAQKEVADAQSNLEACLRTIEDMYRQIDETRDSISRNERSGQADVHWIVTSEAFIEAQKIRIHKERMHARELIRVLEDKQEALVERLHERKIIEKLKERREQEYKERMARLEQKELDDMTNSRWQLKGNDL